MNVPMFDTAGKELKKQLNQKTDKYEKAGIELGDVILNINSKDTSNYSLQEITQFFYEKSGKTIRLKVDRNGRRMSFQFQLEDLLK